MRGGRTMSVKEDRDFLDILRFLNKENINQSPELRDSFFKSLMVCANDAPEYLGSLSDAYFRGFEKQRLL